MKSHEKCMKINMSDTETTYCRLCAEPTEKSCLISPEQDVAVTSKIVTKMLWINIDVTTPRTLPKSICFSCFDLLERTWRFLQCVRTAQTKLNEIFCSKRDGNKKVQLTDDIAKPVDKDWAAFEDMKPEVKNEYDLEIAEEPLLLNCISAEIKDETSFDDIGMDGDSFKTSDDDDAPLLSVVKRRVKKKIKYEANNATLESSESIQCPVLTWDAYTWRCGNCDALFQNLQSLQLHSIQIHSSCCVFKCNECSKNVQNFRQFVRHVREHKKLLRYCCEYCNKRFERTPLLKKHYGSHLSEVFLMCENCGSVFDTSDQLQDHIILYSRGCKRRSINAKPDLKCDICEKDFKTRGNLQQHKLLHTERSRDFSCHKCGKMFFTKGTLSTHMMTHEEVKPYKCEHCSMSFRARGNLHSHMSLHSGSKPFVCEQCGKSFRVKRLLKSHYIVHTDLMPFVCEYCNKSFRFKTRLNLHLRQHTGAKPYTCLYCQRDFTNGSNFKKHMKRRHNLDTSRKKYTDVLQHMAENNEITILGTS